MGAQQSTPSAPVPTAATAFTAPLSQNNIRVPDEKQSTSASSKISNVVAAPKGQVGVLPQSHAATSGSTTATTTTQTRHIIPKIVGGGGGGGGSGGNGTHPAATTASTGASSANVTTKTAPTKAVAAPATQQPVHSITRVGPLTLTTEQLKSFSRRPIESCILFYGAHLDRTEIEKMTTFDIIEQARVICRQWRDQEIQQQLQKKFTQAVEKVTEQQQRASSVSMTTTESSTAVPSTISTPTETKQDTKTRPPPEEPSQSQTSPQITPFHWNVNNMPGEMENQLCALPRVQTQQPPQQQPLPNSVESASSPIDRWLDKKSDRPPLDNPFDVPSDPLDSQSSSPVVKRRSARLNKRADTKKVAPQPAEPAEPADDTNHTKTTVGSQATSLLQSPSQLPSMSSALVPSKSLSKYSPSTAPALSTSALDRNTTQDHDMFLQHVTNLAATHDKQVQLGGMSCHYWTEEDKQQHVQMIERTRGLIKECMPKLEQNIRLIGTECNQRKQDIDGCAQFVDDVFMQHQQRKLSERTQLLERYKTVYQQTQRIL